MAQQFQTVGRFATENGRKYMTQLCKHFGHKLPAEVEGDQGQVIFAAGVARLQSDATGLTARLSAGSDDEAARLQTVIDNHLKRFAFREDFTGMDWSPVAGTA